MLHPRATTISCAPPSTTSIPGKPIISWPRILKPTLYSLRYHAGPLLSPTLTDPHLPPLLCLDAAAWTTPGDMDGDTDGKMSKEEYEEFVHDLFDAAAMRVKAYDQLHHQKHIPHFEQMVGDAIDLWLAFDANEDGIVTDPEYMKFLQSDAYTQFGKKIHDTAIDLHHPTGGTEEL